MLYVFLFGFVMFVGLVFCKGSWFGGLALTLKWAGIGLIVFIVIGIYQTSNVARDPNYYITPGSATYNRNLHIPPPADPYAQPAHVQNQVASAPAAPRRQFDGIYNPETQAPMNAPAAASPPAYSAPKQEALSPTQVDALMDREADQEWLVPGFRCPVTTVGRQNLAGWYTQQAALMRSQQPYGSPTRVGFYDDYPKYCDHAAALLLDPNFDTSHIVDPRSLQR
ncbi:MAG: hypothetical protein ACRYFS_14985 [Janthinobacterium lividum]